MENKYWSTKRLFWYQLPLGFKQCYVSLIDWYCLVTFKSGKGAYLNWYQDDFWSTLGQGLSSCWTKR